MHIVYHGIDQTEDWTCYHSIIFNLAAHPVMRTTFTNSVYDQVEADRISEQYTVITSFWYTPPIMVPILWHCYSWMLEP